jgi:flagellar protein FliS
VLTASPHRLHLLVVDGAIRFARQAQAALLDRKWEQLDRLLSRSRDCVSELIGGLRPEQSPELAAQCKELFVFAYRNLVQSDLERDAGRIEAAVKVLERHRETWQELGLKLQEDAARVPAPLGRNWVT